MNTGIPVLKASKEAEESFYVMECTLTVERSERIGEYVDDRRVELRGYVNREILDVTCDLMREVLV